MATKNANINKDSTSSFTFSCHSFLFPTHSTFFFLPPNSLFFFFHSSVRNPLAPSPRTLAYIYPVLGYPTAIVSLMKHVRRSLENLKTLQSSAMYSRHIAPQASKTANCQSLPAVTFGYSICYCLSHGPVSFLERYRDGI